jgi:hypothetical protein
MPLADALLFDRTTLQARRGMGVVKRMTAAALLTTVPYTVLAQEYSSAPLIAPSDMVNYCVYGGLVYSVGSQICIMKESPPLYCDQPAVPQGATGPRPRAGWTTSQPPATINCTNDLITGGPARPVR